MVGSDCLPVQWVEAQASVLLLTLMQQCETKYELCKLMQLLADMERLLKSNGEKLFWSGLIFCIRLALCYVLLDEMLYTILTTHCHVFKYSQIRLMGPAAYTDQILKYRNESYSIRVMLIAYSDQHSG